MVDMIFQENLFEVINLKSKMHKLRSNFDKAVTLSELMSTFKERVGNLSCKSKKEHG